MSAFDPSGHSQPTLQQVYETPGNPAEKNPTEREASAFRSPDGSKTIDSRVASQKAPEDSATASSLGRGVRGTGIGEESKGLTEEDVGRHRELDGQQMAPPGEGDVADAVAGRGRGGDVGGEQNDLAANLDRKKAEQSEARERIKQQRAAGEDVGDGLG